MRDSRRVRAVSSWALVSMVVVGCGAPSEDRGTEIDDPHAAFATRDSAGIHITESFRPAWPVESGWRVEPRPFIQIGSRSGDDSQPAFGRIGDVVRFGDGRIAVGDQQAVQVLVFDSVGRFVEPWGGRGQGPGEFQGVDRLFVTRGDSLVVRNEGMGRHEIYGPNGEHARSVRATGRTASAGMGEVSGWLDDGSFIVASISVPGPELRPGRQVVEGEWYWFDPMGEPMGLYAVLPERVVEIAEGSPRSSPVALAPRAQSHAAGSGLWHGFPNSFEIRTVGPTGVDRIIRRAWSPQSVTRSLRDAYQRWFATSPPIDELNESARADYVELGRSAVIVMERDGSVPAPPVSDTLPAFVRLIVARDGYLWAEEHASVGELLQNGAMATSSGRWSVFAPDGRWLGTVEMPPNLRVTVIGADYVLGVWRDEVGVGYVRLHRIIKDSGAW